MSKTYFVSIPVKAYVKKYVATVEGSPIEFSSNSMLCTIIRAFMENKNYTGLSQSQLETAINSRTEKLQISIPIKKMYTIGTTIRQDGIIFINRFLEDCFDKALAKFMKEHTKKNGRYRGIQEALIAFAECYNIELYEDMITGAKPDITLDGLKQMDYRLRKKSDTNKGSNIFSNLVPSF